MSVCVAQASLCLYGYKKEESYESAAPLWSAKCQPSDISAPVSVNITTTRHLVYCINAVMLQKLLLTTLGLVIVI